MVRNRGGLLELRLTCNMQHQVEYKSPDEQAGEGNIGSQGEEMETVIN